MLVSGVGYVLRTYHMEYIISVDSNIRPVTAVKKHIGRVGVTENSESGKIIDVHESVDYYALGKIMYYMVSGGTRIPRESHRNNEYKHIFEINHKYFMLGKLLDNLICLFDKRINKAEKIQSNVSNTLYEKFAGEKLANPDEKFNPSDVIDDNLPQRRLVFAGNSSNSWFVCYEHGGYGLHCHLIIFSIERTSIFTINPSLLVRVDYPHNGNTFAHHQ